MRISSGNQRLGAHDRPLLSISLPDLEVKYCHPIRMETRSASFPEESEVHGLSLQTGSLCCSYVCSKMRRAIVHTTRARRLLKIERRIGG